MSVLDCHGSYAEAYVAGADPSPLAIRELGLASIQQPIGQRRIDNDNNKGSGFKTYLYSVAAFLSLLVAFIFAHYGFHGLHFGGRTVLAFFISLTGSAIASLLALSFFLAAVTQ